MGNSPLCHNDLSKFTDHEISCLQSNTKGLNCLDFLVTFLCCSVVSQLQETFGFSEVLTTLVHFIAVISLSVDVCDTSYFAHNS